MVLGDATPSTGTPFNVDAPRKEEVRKSQGIDGYLRIKQNKGDIFNGLIKI